MKLNIRNFTNLTENRYFGDCLCSGCDTFYLIVIGILGSSIVLAGLLGNALSLYLISKIGKLSTTFFLLKCLAITDTLVLLTFAFNYVFQYFMDRMELRLEVSNAYFYQHVFHYLVFPLYCVTFTLTAWLTCLLTINR